jgi:predicted Fe-Mo cluster-binding NifX family protein
MLSAFVSLVTIAIPVCQERVSPVLDTAARLLLVTRRRGKEVARREFVLGLVASEALARSVAELHVDVLLCAALSEPLRRALEQSGVRVRPHLCGNVEAVLRAFVCGGLRRDEFRMPGCWGWHLHGQCCRRHLRVHAGNSGATQRTKKTPA